MQRIAIFFDTEVENQTLLEIYRAYIYTADDATQARIVELSDLYNAASSQRTHGTVTIHNSVQEAIEAARNPDYPEYQIETPNDLLWYYIEISDRDGEGRVVDIATILAMLTPDPLL